MATDPVFNEGDVKKEVMDLILPQFELLQTTIIQDREKLRGRAWQALALAGVLMAFLTNQALDHIGTWPLFAHVFCVAQIVNLIRISIPLAKATWLPRAYSAPGEEPGGWLSNKEFLQQDVTSIMIGRARRIKRGIDYNRGLVEAEAKALGSFVKRALLSPIIPALLAAVVWLSTRSEQQSPGRSQVGWVRSSGSLSFLQGK